MTKPNIYYWELDMDSKVAIIGGLANPKTTRSSISPSCSTGNCSFLSYNNVNYSSIAMCKKCVDITPWVIEIERLTTVLP
jgi:hypothetical protein